jgi:hypothetical protein
MVAAASSTAATNYYSFPVQHCSLCMLDELFTWKSNCENGSVPSQHGSSFFFFIQFHQAMKGEVKKRRCIVKLDQINLIKLPDFIPN